MIWIAALLTLSVVFLLLGGKALAPTAREDEARRLIAHYREQSSAEQEDNESRLYHDLAALLQTQRTGKTHRARPLLLLLIPLALTGALLYWYEQSGAETLRWQRLHRHIVLQLRQGQLLGEDAFAEPDFPAQLSRNIAAARFFPENSRTHPLLLYCQALQRSLQHHDPKQLEALGSCYGRLNLYELAEPVYARLHSQYPENDDYLLQRVQAATLATPGEALPRELIMTLEDLRRRQPDNQSALLFLAAAYQQHGEIDAARALWEILAQQMSPEDPLYEAVRRTLDTLRAQDAAAARQNYRLTLRVDSQLLQTLSAEAALFVTAAPTGERMPILVKKLPVAAEQTLILSEADSMNGGQIDAETLDFRLILSPDGNVGHPQTRSSVITVPADSSAPIELRLAP